MNISSVHRCTSVSFSVSSCQSRTTPHPQYCHPLPTTFFGYFEANTRYHKTSYPSTLVSISQGFPGGASGKEPARPGDNKRQGFHLWVRKIPLGKAWQSTPVFLPGESHGQRSLVCCSPWGHNDLQ